MLDTKLIRKKNKKNLLPYFLSAPAVIGIVIFLIIPIIYSVYLSFTNAPLLNIRSGNFVGLQNYLHFFSSASFKKVIIATLIFIISNVSLTYFIGLGIASILNNPLKGNAFFKTLVIIPWIIPDVVIVIIWKWMTNPQYGVLNYLLHKMGFIPESFGFLSNYKAAFFIIILVTVWKQYPLSCIMLLAGMKSIPFEHYEAASIDGANIFQKFTNITLPGLRHVTSVLLLLLIIWSFGNFVIIWLLTGGGPADRTATLPIWSYMSAFKFGQIGYGAAIGFICLIVVLIVSILYYQLFMKRLESN